MTDAEIADILERAADEVNDRGWCQGRPMDHEGHVCIYGAIGVATGLELRGTFMSDYLVITNDPRASSVIDVMVSRDRGFVWNDSYAKDEYEVADELRRAAKDLRNAA